MQRKEVDFIWHVTIAHKTLYSHPYSICVPIGAHATYSNRWNKNDIDTFRGNIGSEFADGKRKLFVD